jgi:peptidoglycan/LPS O-acetylase OafA/YrhL
MSAAPIKTVQVPSSTMIQAGGAMLGKDRPLQKIAHMVQLDGLRAIAALAVIVHHFKPFTIPNGVDIGAAGVKLFFVLSGFLITGILLRARDAYCAAGTSLRHVFFCFYVRRVLRIFPLYYAVLFTAVLADLPRARDDFPWYGFYLSNYLVALHPEGGPGIQHFWTLAVEEQFYLCWPFIILLTPRRWLLSVILVTIAAAPTYRLGMALSTRNLAAATAGVLSCSDTLGIGALLAFLWHSGKPGRAIYFNLRLGAFLGLGMFSLLFIMTQCNGSWTILTVLKDTAFVLIFPWLVHGAAIGFHGSFGSLLSCRLLVYLGKISYGLYIFHPFVPFITSALALHIGIDLSFPDLPALRCISVILISILLAGCSWLLLERPLIDLKRHFPHGPLRPVSYPVDAVRPQISRDGSLSLRSAIGGHTTTPLGGGDQNTTGTVITVNAGNTA